ncbi:MAG: hypothetical protein J1F67_05130 [Muribaculaceae bacterium]|nr:hypothetical protein [Muribaculaceae bacterium]
MANPRLTLTLSADDKISQKIKEVQKEITRIQTTSKSAKGELMAMQRVLGHMNLDGLHNTAAFTEIAEYAGNIADALGDARQAVNAFANDNFKLEAMGQGLSLIATAGNLVSASMELYGEKNEKVAEAIKKVQIAMNLLNGVQQVANYLNKDSALMLRLKQVRMKISAITTKEDTAAITSNTIATGANTAATTLATKAKQRLNTAVAIGKAIVGDWTGVVLLGAAPLTSYAMFSDEAKDKTEDLEGSLTKAKDSMQSFKEKVSESAGATIGKFRALQTQWLSLQDTASKTQWIKDNQSAFSSLGMSIKDVTDAENAFVNNTANVVKSLEARAKAAAAQTMMEKAYEKKWQDDQNVETKGQYSVIAKNDPLFAEMQRMGYIHDTNITSNNGEYRYRISSEEGARYYNSKNEFKRNLEFQDTIGELEEMMVSAMKEVANTDTGNLFSGNSEPTKNTSPKPTAAKEEKKPEIYDPSSIKYAQKMAAETRKLWEEAPQGMRPTLKSALDYWEEEVKKRQGKVEVEVEVEPQITKGSLSDLQNQLKDITDQLSQIDPGDESKIESLKSRYAELTEQIKELNIALGFETAEVKENSNEMMKGVEVIGSAVNTLGGAMQNLAKDNEDLAKAAAVTQAVGTLALTFAQSMKGTMTPWDWIAGAVAGVATLTSVVSQLQGFESGGIVGGTSTVGDRTLIRANKGEMILNPRQQDNLFKAIDNNRLGSSQPAGTVKFVIDGDKLVGTLNNYNSKMRRQS